MKPIIAGMTGLEYLAAINNIRKEYNVKDYEVVGNGVTDDTVAIQALINVVFAAGGGVIYFPPGTYVIGGALQRDIGGIDYKSQLYIPFSSIAATIKPTIVFKGEYPNFGAFAGNGGGAILKSTLVSDVAYSYVLASAGLAGGGNFLDFNYTEVYIEDIRIHVTTNSSGAITLGGLGFQKSGDLVVRRVGIYGSFGNGATEVVTPINNCVAFAFPAINCQGFAIAEECSTNGFESGYLTGDHTVLNNCYAGTCIYGFNIGANNLIATIFKCETGWCVNDFYFGSGTCYVNVLSFNNECVFSTGKYYDYSKTILDPNNYGHGTIYYMLTEAGVGYNNARFSKTEGAHIQCIPIGFATDSFVVTGARDETEGALKSLLTALAARGIIIDTSTAS
jgi:hypothetical protein